MQDFDVIEIQATFYQPPANAVAQRWKAIAPAGFRFCMKAWQLITHTPSSPTYRRLKSGVSDSEKELYGSFRPTEQVALAWERTREIAAILGAEVIVFQCPASFLPHRENLRNLDTFFQGIDRDGRLLAWEPRGAEWSDTLIRDLCAAKQPHSLRGPLRPAFGVRRFALLAPSRKRRLPLSVYGWRSGRD